MHPPWFKNIKIMIW